MDEKDTPLDEIFNTVGVAIITIDDFGIITSGNEAAIRLFGHSQAELLGENVSMLMPEPYQSEHDKYLQNYHETQVAKIIGRGRQVTGLRKDGSTFPMHLSVAKHRVEGKTGFTGIVQDLSELDQARAANERLGRILDRSANEIYVFDASTLKFSMVNQGAADNLGYSPGQLSAMTPVDLKPYSEAEFRVLIAPLINGEKNSLEIETTHRRENGTRYDVEILLHLSHAVDPPEFVAIVQDVTDKNRMLDALHRSQRMESVGNLTGGIAHDFNNLLTVISGNLELLDLQIKDSSHRELLVEAREASAMGARLTQRLLAFARQSRLLPTQVDVNVLILGLSEMLRRTLGDNIELKTNLVSQLSPTTVDISQLENAVVNLALNARDAMSDGGTLLIETTSVDVQGSLASQLEIEPGTYVNIRISDTGTGVPQDLLQKIFEPFVTTKKDTHGTGLGLSMVYGFTRQSGGNVKVTSVLGQGTTFDLYLPQSSATGQQQQNPTESMELSNESIDARTTVLVVEDEERVRRLTVRRLTALGYEVIEAADGYAGLEAYRENDSIDLVFSDVVMTQGMSGYDLAVEIKSVNPQARILLTSGYADDVVSTEKLDALNLRLLRKPYDQSELIAALEGELST
ncbi:MAG: PAS domain S-box protein [Granulosicoccus sp.]|nr:PAS domain S-box protein [Granulosicoccus sp.]